MSWKPRVTVAVIAEQRGRFLMVEEHADGQIRFNQPAGHLEDRESLVDAVVRECLEETAWHFEPQALVGIYRWRNPDSDATFLRATFSGRCRRNPSRPRPMVHGLPQSAPRSHTSHQSNCRSGTTLSQPRGRTQR